MATDKVKVVLLRDGTPYGKPGTEVEVPKNIAEHLCAVRHGHDGYKAHKYRCARLASEKPAESESPTAASLAGMTQHEAAQAGIKNVAGSDPAAVGQVSQTAAELKAASDADAGAGAGEKGAEKAEKPKTAAQKKAEKKAADKAAAAELKKQSANGADAAAGATAS
jgi:hypothetical protein